MANVQKGITGTINSADNYLLGDVGPRGGVMTIQLDSSSFSGSITVKARARGATTFRTILYRPHFINNAAAATTEEVSTAITNSSLIQVAIADGMEISLDCTSFTSGSMAYFAAVSS